MNKSILFLYINQIVTIIFGVILIPFYIEYLGFGVYGYIALFSITGIVISNIDFGIFSSINKELAYSKKRSIKIGIPQTVGMVEGMALIILTISLSSYYIYGNWIRIIDNQNIVLIIIWSCSKLLDNMYRQILFGLQLQKFYSQLNIFLTISKGIIIFYLIKFWKAEFQSYLIGLLIPLLIGLVIYRFKIKNYLYYKINLKIGNLSNELIDISKKFFLINILGQLLLQLDKIVVYVFSVNMNSFGFYAVGLTIAGMVITAAAPIQQYLFSKLPNLANNVNKQHAYKYYNNSYRIIIVCALFVVALYPLISPIALGVLFGDVGGGEEFYNNIYKILVAYCMYVLINSKVIYLQVTNRPKKSVNILLMMIVIYLVVAMIIKNFWIYDPANILLFSYTTGYIYSVYLMLMETRKFNGSFKNILYEIAILTLIFCIYTISKLSTGLYPDDNYDLRSTWYLIFTIVLVILLIFYYLYLKYNKNAEH